MDGLASGVFNVKTILRDLTMMNPTGLIIAALGAIISLAGGLQSLTEIVQHAYASFKEFLGIQESLREVNMANASSWEELDKQMKVQLWTEQMKQLEKETIKLYNEHRILQAYVDGTATAWQRFIVNSKIYADEVGKKLLDILKNIWSTILNFYDAIKNTVNAIGSFVNAHESLRKAINTLIPVVETLFKGFTILWNVVAKLFALMGKGDQIEKATKMLEKNNKALDDGHKKWTNYAKAIEDTHSKIEKVTGSKVVETLTKSHADLSEELDKLSDKLEESGMRLTRQEKKIVDLLMLPVEEFNEKLKTLPAEQQKMYADIRKQYGTWENYVDDVLKLDQDKLDETKKMFEKEGLAITDSQIKRLQHLIGNEKAYAKEVETIRQESLIKQAQEEERRQKEITAAREKAAKERMDLIDKEIGYVTGETKAVADLMQNFLKQELDDKNNQYQQDLANLTKYREQGMITETDFAKRKTALEEENASQSRKIQRQMAEIQRGVAIFNVIVDTAQAIMKALASSPPPVSYMLAAATGALAATQLASILTQPLPKPKEADSYGPQSRKGRGAYRKRREESTSSLKGSTLRTAI